LFPECREYGQIAYKQVTVPSQIPGERPTVTKIGKCMYKSVSLVVGGEEAKVNL
jgi:hypothetical protein